nr:hypothetical protein [Tanacetum cinerariifolium]
ALDEALVPHASRLRIGKSNFHLRSDITSNESTLQVVYDVLRLTLFYKAFLVTADVPEIYMQEFWATATVHHHSIRFKMNNKKRYDSLRLSQAQILWGMYHKKNVNFAYLLWEDFIYQVKHKDAKKSNEMYYLRFTKVIINFFMTKDPSIPRRNKFGAMLPVELTNEDIRNTAAYKEYYAIASGAEPPKTKASVRKTQSRTGIIPGVLDVPTYESDEEISWKSSDEDDDDDVDDQNNDGDDFVHPKLTTHDEEAKDDESFDPIVQTPSHVEKFDDEGNDDASHGMNVGGDEGPDAEDNDNELYGEVNINLDGRDVQMTYVHTTQVLEDTHVTLTRVNPDGQQQSSSVLSQFVTSMLNLSPDTGIDSLFESIHRVDIPVMTTVEPLLLSVPTLPPPSIAIISQVQQAPTPSPTTAPSTSLQDLLNFGSLFGFDHHFLNKLDEHIQKIIKEQVKEQVKVQVSKILSKIEKTVNEQLEVEVLNRVSNSSKTSYVVAADLSELELKKILIKKIESKKSIHRSDEQRNLYKALVDAYECDKIILDTYGDTVTLKRRRGDEDKDEEPSAGSDQGSKRRRAGKKPASTTAPKEKVSKTSGKSTEGSKSHQKIINESAPAKEPMYITKDLEEPAHQEVETCATDDQPIAEASQHPEWFQKQTKPPTPDRAWNKTLPATHRSIQPWISDLDKQADFRTSFNELMDTPVDFSAFLMNRLKVDTLTPELLVGPTYELMKGSCKSLVELEFFLEEVYKVTTDQLDWNNPKGQQYPHNLLKPLPLIPNYRGLRVIPFDHFVKNKK